MYKSKEEDSEQCTNVNTEHIIKSPEAKITATNSSYQPVVQKSRLPSCSLLDDSIQREEEKEVSAEHFQQMNDFNISVSSICNTSKLL